MTSAAVSTPSSDAGAVEAYGRGPLLLLVGSALTWLAVSGIFALIAGIQLFTPAFLADCQLLNHGHVVALAETSFVYGWMANAGLGLILWILARLGGEPLRAANWIAAGACFWNLGILLALVGIVFGEATAIPLLELPRAVQPLLLAAYGAMAVGGVLAWTGRRRDVMYASHWYAVAALFLFPWLFSIAQVTLLWFPVRGTLQAVVAGWYAQGLWTLWMAPLALATAYYIVPKSTGKILPSYDFASLGFWTLLFVGAWTGGRHLIGGPVPAWISTIAIVASATLLFHYAIVWLNLRSRECSLPLAFIQFGLCAYVLGGVVDALSAVRGVAEITQFTHFDEAQQTLAFSGAASMMLLGGIYYALPRLTGRPWAWAGLVRLHLALSSVGILVLVVSLAAAGVIQGRDLNQPAVTFAEIATHTHAMLLLATMAQALLLLGNVLLLANFFKSALCPYYAAAAAAIRQGSGVPAEASSR